MIKFPSQVCGKTSLSGSIARGQTRNVRDSVRVPQPVRMSARCKVYLAAARLPSGNDRYVRTLIPTAYVRSWPRADIQSLHHLNERDDPCTSHTKQPQIMFANEENAVDPCGG